MKKYYLFIALAMVVAMTVSCKNNRKAKTDETVTEVVDAAKTILADDVLETIDEFAKTFTDEAGNVDVQSIIASALTEEEKLVRPEYLLEADDVNNLVTKSQKVRALAFLVAEHPIRKAYGLSTEETSEAIARLMAELNHPTTIDEMNNLTIAEKIRKDYELCRANGELSYFWQFSFCIMTELQCIIANNVDAFYRNLTDEQYQAFHNRFLACRSALLIMEEYDEEVAILMNAYRENRTISDNEGDIVYATKDGVKQHFIKERKAIVNERNSFLK